MARMFSSVFGALFGLIWIMIWVIVIATIIKSFKATKNVRNTTNQVLKEVNDALKNGSIHTGNPRYTAGPKATQSSADDYSDVKEKDSETFNSDLNPKTTAQRVYRTKTTVNGRRVRGDRNYAVNPSERPAHGKLSRESRDDEKEWF
ncbi:MAG: hypothetical protein J5528_02725 [Firmicutes bacterium]|nr:hypothetical protein [Bacillota bacterium]